jgi:hypothetical protein
MPEAPKPKNTIDVNIFRATAGTNFILAYILTKEGKLLARCASCGSYLKGKENTREQGCVWIEPCQKCLSELTSKRLAMQSAMAPESKGQGRILDVDEKGVNGNEGREKKVPPENTRRP